MDPKKSNPLLNFGLIGALLSLLSFLILYLGGASLFVNPWAFALIIIPITIVVLACRAVKKQNGGFLEFKDALKTTFALFVIMALVSSLATYIVLNFIDVSFKERLTQVSIEKTQQVLKSFGVSSDQIDKTVEAMTKKDNYSIGNTLLNFAFGCIFWFIVSLIVAAIMKKKKPEFPGAVS